MNYPPMTNANFSVGSPQQHYMQQVTRISISDYWTALDSVLST